MGLAAYRNLRRDARLRGGAERIFRAARDCAASVVCAYFLAGKRGDAEHWPPPRFAAFRIESGSVQRRHVALKGRSRFGQCGAVHVTLKGRSRFGQCGAATSPVAAEGWVSATAATPASLRHPLILIAQ